MRERDHLVDPGGDRRIILRLISKLWDWEACTGLAWLRMQKGGGRS